MVFKIHPFSLKMAIYNANSSTARIYTYPNHG
jgi:hypothetical protein